MVSLPLSASLLVAGFAALVAFMERLCSTDSLIEYTESIIERSMCIFRQRYASHTIEKCSLPLSYVHTSYFPTPCPALRKPPAVDLLAALKNPMSPCTIPYLRWYFKSARLPQTVIDTVDVLVVKGQFMCLWGNVSTHLLWSNDSYDQLRERFPKKGVADPDSMSVGFLHPSTQEEFLEVIHSFLSYALDLCMVDYHDLVAFFHYLIFENCRSYGRQWQFGYCLLLRYLRELDMYPTLSMASMCDRALATGVDGTMPRTNKNSSRFTVSL